MIPRFRHAALAVAATFIIAVGVAGCGPSPASPSATLVPPTEVARSDLPAETTPSPPRSAQPDVGQTDTEWGTIWDRLPSGFPIYPGSTPSEEAATGPASAVYVTPEGDPSTMATWFQDQLEGAAFSTDSLSGPMEDGSFVIESTGESADCHVQVTIAPLGDSGTIATTVLYGAACPQG